MIACSIADLLRVSPYEWFWEGHGFQPCRHRSRKMRALAPEGPALSSWNICETSSGQIDMYH
jgi:hypothetical protein